MQNSRPFKFTLGAMLVLTGLVAILFAGWRSWGQSGIAPALALNSIAWFVLSRMKSEALHPINHERMTVVELLVLLVICGVLHGLLMPAVQSRAHPRRQAPPSSTENSADAP